MLPTAQTENKNHVNMILQGPQKKLAREDFSFVVPPLYRPDVREVLVFDA